MALVALINDCRQYSEDAWEPSPKIKDITPETTIQDLIDWHNSIYKNSKNLTQIHIIEKMD